MTRIALIFLHAIVMFFIGYTAAADGEWYVIFIILGLAAIATAAIDVLSSNISWKWSDFFSNHTGTIPPIAANYGIPQQILQVKTRVDLESAVFDDELLYYEALLFEDDTLILELHKQEGIDPYLKIQNKKTGLEYWWDNTDYLRDIANGEVTTDDEITAKQFKQVYFFLNRCRDRGWL